MPFVLTHACRLRLLAGVIALVLACIAFGIVATGTLRPHACEYDAFGEWSEVGLVLSCLGSAILAAVAGIMARRHVLAVAIVLPAAAGATYGIAMHRHEAVEDACLRRTLPQAVVACGLVPSDVVARRLGDDTILSVRGGADARLCLATWADWHDGMHVDGETV